MLTKFATVTLFCLYNLGEASSDQTFNWEEVDPSQFPPLNPPVYSPLNPPVNPRMISPMKPPATPPRFPPYSQPTFYYLRTDSGLYLQGLLTKSATTIGGGKVLQAVETPDPLTMWKEITTNSPTAIVNTSFDYCLDGRNGAPDGAVDVHNCRSSDNEIWSIQTFQNEQQETRFTIVSILFTPPRCVTYIPTTTGNYFALTLLQDPPTNAQRFYVEEILSP